MAMKSKKGKWEGSPKDMALDRKGAKKSGMSTKQWESSAADAKKDKVAKKKFGFK